MDEPPKVGDLATEDVPLEEADLDVVLSLTQSLSGLEIPESLETEAHASSWIQSFLMNVLQVALDGVPPYYETIEARTARYLNEQNGNKILAWEQAYINTTCWSSKLKRALWESIPIVGMAAAVVHPIWFNLRAVAYIACLHGHDVRSDEVKAKILECLVVRPANTVAQEVGKPMITHVAVNATTQSTAAVVKPVIVEIVAKRAVEDGVGQVVTSVGKHGAKTAFSTVGYLVGGGVGAEVFKELGAKTGADQLTFRASKLVGDFILSTPILSSQLTAAASASSSVAKTAQTATAWTAGVLGCMVAVPLNLFLAWVTDNSDQIHQQAKDVFVPYRKFEINKDGDDW